MKKQLFLIGMLGASCISFAQTDRLWSAATPKNPSEIFENKSSLTHPKTFHLDINGLRNSLLKAPKQQSPEQPGVLISFPDAEGKMESFKVRENSNFDPQLAAKYPDIRSYTGESTKDPGVTIYFSISPLGLSSMEIYNDRSALFIEPYTKDLSTYVVYKRAEKNDQLNAFECGVIDTAQKSISKANDMTARPNADDGKLRTFRLALSCTGEYTASFGGTKANALAAMNNTMTRINGIFEKDFSARMILISNNDALIYTSSATDPYSPSSQPNDWHSQLLSTLTSVIGDTGYDIGHLFGKSGGGGNAGCIGCVCLNGWKGRGYTAPDIVSGEYFDLIVAHEMGHQFGANHTFSHVNENTGVNMEPGSGSTIMSYAGVTSQNVQQNFDSFFHAISIQQVTDNIKFKSCPVVTNTGNSIPTANAGADYTIPKGTPFMLTGTGTDANGDALTYIWEELDNALVSQTGANSAASPTKASGPVFRSWTPTSSPVRYFPKMSSILSGATTTQGLQIPVEALADVARTYNFRFTVRDNRAGGSGNNSDDAVITVNGAAGPFRISSQNSAVSYAGGSSQIITWDVAGTTSNNINAANVDILWSANGGVTWTNLLVGTPNDGSQAVNIPNVSTNTGRIMVKGSNHIFFDVNNADITISLSPSTPFLYASGTTANSIDLSWFTATNGIAITGYDIYQGSVLIGSTNATAYTVNNLTPSTIYTFTVKAKNALGNTTVSNIASVTTGAVTNTLSYCPATANYASFERIGNVKFGTINNTSTGTAGYEDFTSVSTNVTKGSTYPITVKPVWISSAFKEGYSVYIDYNRNGSFTSDELAWTEAGTANSPVSGNITIPASAVSGATRMRIIMKQGSAPLSPCGSYPYGQVEDYTLHIVSPATGKNTDTGMITIKVNTPDTATPLKPYPNPVSDVLHISGMTDEEYSIFTMSGQLIFSGKLKKGSANVSSLISGSYLIHIGGATTRFIKN